jgi:hypothetical protein
LRQIVLTHADTVSMRVSPLPVVGEQPASAQRVPADIDQHTIGQVQLGDLTGTEPTD